MGFSAVATLAQWRLHAVAVLSPMMASTNSILGGVLLVAAGVFQFTPLKRACLVRCRSPLNFLMSDWRECTAPGFSDTRQRYAASCAVSVAAIQFRLVSAGLR